MLLQLLSLIHQILKIYLLLVYDYSVGLTNMVALLGGWIARYYARINSNISLVAPCEVVIILFIMFIGVLKTVSFVLCYDIYFVKEQSNIVVIEFIKIFLWTRQDKN